MQCPPTRPGSNGRKFHLVCAAASTSAMERSSFEKIWATLLSQLKRLGFHIAVDDFGTGYSSLSYLHQLPIDTLKIDKSFIDKVTEPAGTRPIVEAVLSLSRSLSLTTIAEGVESREQCEILNQLGCDIIQGFYFFKPLPIDSVEQLLSTSVQRGHARSLAPMPAGD